MVEPISKEINEVSDGVAKERIAFGLSDRGMTTLCVLFLLFSIAFWLWIDSSAGKAVYYILFLLPNYLSAQWLAGKLFHRHSKWSTSNSGFSVVRIIVGVFLVLAVFGIGYGISFLFG